MAMTMGHFEIFEYLQHREELLQVDPESSNSMYKRRIMEFYSPIAANDMDMSDSLDDLFTSTHRSMYPHIELRLDSTHLSDNSTDSNIEISIRPLLFDLDPGLLLRMKRFVKDLSCSDSQLQKFKFPKKEKKKDAGHKMIKVEAPSIDLRFSGWNLRKLD